MLFSSSQHASLIHTASLFVLLLEYCCCLALYTFPYTDTHYSLRIYIHWFFSNTHSLCSLSSHIRSTRLYLRSICINLRFQNMSCSLQDLYHSYIFSFFAEISPLALSGRFIFFSKRGIAKLNEFCYSPFIFRFQSLTIFAHNHSAHCLFHR